MTRIVIAYEICSFGGKKRDILKYILYVFIIQCCHLQNFYIVVVFVFYITVAIATSHEAELMLKTLQLFSKGN